MAIKVLLKRVGSWCSSGRANTWPLSASVSPLKEVVLGPFRFCRRRLLLRFELEDDPVLFAFALLPALFELLLTGFGVGLGLLLLDIVSCY